MKKISFFVAIAAAASLASSLVTFASASVFAFSASDNLASASALAFTRRFSSPARWSCGSAFRASTSSSPRKRSKAPTRTAPSSDPPASYTTHHKGAKRRPCCFSRQQDSDVMYKHSIRKPYKSGG